MATCSIETTAAQMGRLTRQRGLWIIDVAPWGTPPDCRRLRRRVVKVFGDANEDFGGAGSTGRM